MKRWLISFLLLMLGGNAVAQINVILDADIDSDVDDVAALAIIQHLAAAGQFPADKEANLPTGTRKHADSSWPRQGPGIGSIRNTRHQECRRHDVSRHDVEKVPIISLKAEMKGM